MSFNRGNHVGFWLFRSIFPFSVFAHIVPVSNENILSGVRFSTSDLVCIKNYNADNDVICELRGVA